ncbi:uncharacterized protein LOC114332089 [Diabrotica virgifera virgifera]|uniref:Uncharacterized protein LOC114332089 n=1 Tax=Diabrotica virgifera virgifera TaxID=50390 RepID=A0A6P7FMS5_DIAVI|nr:uncharacterized protein LOC114332089 [Diabrotica virgifera virgifera]
MFRWIVLWFVFILKIFFLPIFIFIRIYKFIIMRVSEIVRSSRRLMSTRAEYNGLIIQDRTKLMLEKVAQDEGFVDKDITCYGQVGKGQGVTGELFFVNIYARNSNKRLELLIKQASTNKKVLEYFPVNLFYKNEANFYELVWREFEKQQQRRLGRLLFDNIPKAYDYNVNPGEECIVLENVGSKGFRNINKREIVPNDIMELIVKKYAQFHGLSYVLKKSDPRKYDELAQKFVPYWEQAKEIVPLNVSITGVFTKCIKYLQKPEKPQNPDLINKIKEYNTTGLDVFIQSNNYKGKHGVFLHGDCWSNNMLFKFTETGVSEDLKFIDFQTCKVGSAVYDLSYCIYSGGSKEVFDNLDHYLNLYHKNLVDTCTVMGCDEFISLEELKQEWKDYSKFGWIMAMVILRAKYVKDDAKLDLYLMLTEIEKRDYKKHLEEADEEEIERRTVPLLEHMYQNGFI